MPYHPQMNGQVEVSNGEIKIILMNSINDNCIDWSQKLDDALLDYHPTFNNQIGMSPYQLVFGKACHSPVEQDHKAFWALKHLNLSWKRVVELRFDQWTEIDEFRL